jgi:hypothetical protein
MLVDESRSGPTTSPTVPVLTNTARFIIFLVAVCAVVVVMFVTGGAHKKAKPGSGGRVPVPTATPQSR